MHENEAQIEFDVVGFNAMPDGSCRTLKYQYQKNSLANFMLQNARGATAVQMDIWIPNNREDASEDFVVPVKNATKSGYVNVRGYRDTVNLTAPDSKTRRGRVGVDMANTLDTGCSQGIFVEISPDLKVYAVWYPKKQCYIAIRKLTPLECFRLQGFEDILYKRAEFVNSDSQLFKQAGNSVTVNVIYEIGKKLKEAEE